MGYILNEEFLIELKKGNEKSFRFLFTNYFDSLCNFAQTYIKDEQVSKNIVQDVFIKIWENKKNIKEQLSFFSFMLTITKNSCLDYLKHKQIELKFKNKQSSMQKELELNYFALNRLEIDFLEYDEIESIIEKTLQALPPQCQKVFRLSRFDNLSNAEIATKLGIGQKAVEANITRAIKVFRQELKDYIPILILLNIPLTNIF